jgi:hypothetical protein
MVCIFIVFTFFGLVVRHIECYLKLRDNKNFAEILWKMIRFQLMQADKIDYKLLTGKLVMNLRERDKKTKNSLSFLHKISLGDQALFVNKFFWSPLVFFTYETFGPFLCFSYMKLLVPSHVFY